MPFISCGQKKTGDTETSIENLGNGIYQINGHRFVDLGLPSGLLWAETNIGANSPADIGDFFAWGETKPKTDRTLESYKFFDSAKKTMTKYNDKDGKKALEREDDAAAALWGNKCRIPSLINFAELVENTVWTLADKTNSSGTVTAGFVATSKINGKKIFFPFDESRTMSIWSNTLRQTGHQATGIKISEDYGKCNVGPGGLPRFYTLPIRPVAEP